LKEVNQRMKIVTLWTQSLNTGDEAILYGQQKILDAAFSDIPVIEYSMHAQDATASAKYNSDFNFTQNILKGGRKFSNKYARIIYGALRKPSLSVGRFGYKTGLTGLTKWFLSRNSRNGLSDIFNADLVVSTGGTYLVPHYNISPQLFDYETVIKAKAPLIFFTQSLGPFKNHPEIKRLISAFNYAFLILVRDEQSLEYLTDIKIDPEKIKVVPDAAFILPYTGQNINARISRFRNIRFNGNSKMRVAISVREWRHFRMQDANEAYKAYLDSISRITELLCQKYNAEIVFISTCQGRPEYRYDDSKVASEVVKNISRDFLDKISVNSDSHSPAILQNALERFDLVIATRMHMVILALNAGTPVLPVSYEFKTAELFKRLDMAQFVIDIENISFDVLKDRLESFLEYLPVHYRGLMEKVFLIKKECRETSDVIRSFYESWIKEH
jgi:colanic acid/amylovoran biosynthesis protein